MKTQIAVTITPVTSIEGMSDEKLKAMTLSNAEEMAPVFFRRDVGEHEIKSQELIQFKVNRRGSPLPEGESGPEAVIGYLFEFEY